MTETVTDYNCTEYRLKFSIETGHFLGCIEHTIDEMLFQFADMSFKAGLTKIEGLKMLNDMMTVEKFDVALLKLLSVKQCKCAKIINN